MDRTHLLEVVCGGTVSFLEALGFQNLIHRSSTGVSWLRSKLLSKWSLGALFSAVSNDLRTVQYIMLKYEKTIINE